MSLLSLRHVTKRFPIGQRETVALNAVSLEVDPGECVAVYGARRSGRTTLLRIVSGLLPPDDGEVRFDGVDLAYSRGRRLGRDIGYCHAGFDLAQGGSVTDHVAVSLLAQGIGRVRARERAHAALARAGVPAHISFDPRELCPDELVRAGIARALVSAPRLLLLDEPTNGVDVLERDGILALIRSLAEDGMGVLMTVGEPVVHAHRVLALDAGELRGQTVPEVAPVVQLQSKRVEPFA